MALFNPPTTLNGIPLSERTMWLMFAPIPALLNPRVFFFSTPFEREGTFHRLLPDTRKEVARRFFVLKH